MPPGTSRVGGASKFNDNSIIKPGPDELRRPLS